MLNGDRAVLVNIAIMRTFVKLREIMATHKDLAHKIEALERKYAAHGFAEAPNRVHDGIDTVRSHFAAASRTEQCHITGDTKAKLMAHAEELRNFGVTLEEHRLLKESADALAVIGRALAVADSLDSGVLRKLILYLRDLAIPEEQILRLRLNEPEQVSDVLKMEQRETGGPDC